ncbi:lactonase family protein [Maribacter sp.]|uniref:lactonase family protein n=1 Tax=Maribacter sp. TaxID=1897614 RepID=UPI0025BDF9A2|nr:lactonase family protein [Maribacter sp.]
MLFSTFFIGSYTQKLTPEIFGSGDGISTVQLNEETGEISVLHTKKTVSPSYLTLSTDNKYLYSNTEVIEEDSPVVQAYEIKDDSSLGLLNEQPILGGCPCHIEALNDRILIACYISGNMLEYPIDESGRLLMCAKNHQHSGSSVNLERQEAAHAHQVVAHPNKKDVYVCDLGIDTVKAYEVQENKLTPNPQKDISIRKGGGPRHLVFNKDGSLGYVINELTSAVSVLKNKGNKFNQIGSYNSLPDFYQGAPSASAIRIHPNGKFLYVGNRKLDAITIFKMEEDVLNLVGYKHTNANELREFNISPSGKWLIACHQNSNDTIVYRIRGNGKLIEVYRTKEIKTPVCVAFLK